MCGVRGAVQGSGGSWARARPKMLVPVRDFRKLHSMPSCFVEIAVRTPGLFVPSLSLHVLFSSSVFVLVFFFLYSFACVFLYSLASAPPPTRHMQPLLIPSVLYFLCSLHPARSSSTCVVAFVFPKSSSSSGSSALSLYKSELS